MLEPQVTAPAPTPARSGYAAHPKAQAFAEAVAQRQGWTAEEVLQSLALAQRQPRVESLIMPPPAGKAKNWAAYKARFVEPQRIRAGQAFWKQHADVLERVESDTGVPASLVVGIVGVETFYGQHTGGFKVLDALATLAFDFPSGRSDRSAFFQQELEALLRWCRREGRDPSTVKGSYAGAVGWPQFMPSSILRFAQDGDGDGHIDLERSVPDTIASVAHYLAAHGWVRGLPTHYSVAPPVDTRQRAALLVPDIVPSFSAQAMADLGAVLSPQGRAHEGPLALVELQNGSAAPTFVAGTSNFYAVTRYNWSAYYAMAVIELGRAVQKAGLSEAAPARAKSDASLRANTPAPRPATTKRRTPA